MRSALLQVIRVRAALATRSLVGIGLVPPQELALLYLEQGPSPQRVLVRCLGRDRSTVTATTQAMNATDSSRRPALLRGQTGTRHRPDDAGHAVVPRVNEIWQALTIAGSPT